MNRTELVRLLILDTICDDFENVDQVILHEVAEVGHKCGLTIERPEIVQALRGLVDDGLAKAYDLTRLTRRDPFSGELPAMPPLDVAEEYFRTYFYITEKGKELHADDAWWPFEADGDKLRLRCDWKLSE
jgi:hypothetical protein